MLAVGEAGSPDVRGRPEHRDDVTEPPALPVER